MRLEIYDQMNYFQLNTKTKIYFGVNKRNVLYSILDSKKPKILVLASYNSLNRPLVSEIILKLKNQYSGLELWSDISPNPRIDDIRNCLDNFKKSDFTHIIGIGGGSTLDQAKATALAMGTNEDIDKLIEVGGSSFERKNKLILMPTTSGSGSELSHGSIITDQNKFIKTGLRGENVSADIAIIDPEFTYTKPLKCTMITGFDVLTHAIETMTSKKSSQYTDSFCKTAIKLVFKNLPKLHANINNINARNEMAYSSMIMGASLAISTTCLPHRMQYPIGGITDTPHALGLAAIYPAWMRHAMPFATKKFALGYNSIAKKKIDLNTEKNSLSFVNAVVSLLERIELKCSLNELGLKPKQIKLMITNISGNLETDPSFQSEKDIEKIYRDSFI